MDKILIEVFFPAAEKTYEVKIPLQMRVYEITQLLAKLFGELESGSFSPDGVCSLLCDRYTGGIFNAERTPQELGWKNGKELIFL